MEAEKETVRKGDKGMNLREGLIVRHFKGAFYVVEGVARHSEDPAELFVIYRRLNANGEKGPMCARPLDMFRSETDKEKYPNATQKMRFESTGFRYSDFSCRTAVAKFLRRYGAHD